MRKYVYVILASWALCLACGAQEGEWLTDLTKAKDKARADKKMVLIDFNGSDWCPPCKALRKDVFSSPQFVAYAKTNLVLWILISHCTKSRPRNSKGPTRRWLRSSALKDTLPSSCSAVKAVS